MKVRVYNEKEAPKNVQQPYTFTEQLLRYNFNIYELRVLFRILQLIKTHQKHNIAVQLDIENNVTLLFPVSAFIIPGHKNNDDIRAAIISLREKTITKLSHIEVEINGEIEKLPADEFLGIIENPKWAHNNSYVSFRLNEAWFRYLSDLSRGYTQYMVSVAFNCSNPEAVKMYQFINNWYAQKGKVLSIANFRKEFNIPRSYNISKICTRILDAAKKELDTISDRSFNYTLYYENGEVRNPKEPIKGRRVSKIAMAFYSNHKNIKKYPLSEHEHELAQKWLKRMKSKYKLEELHVKILYSLIQRYSLAYFSTQEIEHRKKILNGLNGSEFVDKLASIVRKQH